MPPQNQFGTIQVVGLSIRRFIFCFCRLFNIVISIHGDEYVRTKCRRYLHYLLWSQNAANDGLCIMISEIQLQPADDLTVQHLYRTIINRRRSAGTAEFYQCMVRSCTVQSYYGPGTIPYCHQPAQAGFFISQSQLVALNLYLKARCSLTRSLQLVSQLIARSIQLMSFSSQLGIYGFFKLNLWSPLFAGIVNSTGMFNSIIVKMLKLVFYFSRWSVPLI